MPCVEYASLHQLDDAIIQTSGKSQDDEVFFLVLCIAVMYQTTMAIIYSNVPMYLQEAGIAYTRICHPIAHTVHTCDSLITHTYLNG